LTIINLYSKTTLLKGELKLANILAAHRVYGPQLKLNATVNLDQIADWMSMRTGINKSEVIMVLQELNEAILYFNCQGTPVKLPGIGIFSPSIDRNGTYRVNLRSDTALRRGLNTPAAYTGQIRNKANIGLDNAGYKELWDEAYPDDPLEI
jgi:nucleoid DNA-binding protein